MPVSQDIPKGKKIPKLSKDDIAKIIARRTFSGVDEDLPSFPTRVVPREEWGAVAAEPRTKKLPHPIKSVVFAYNTGKEVCTNDKQCIKAMQDMQAEHMASGLADIYYNFCVCGNGFVYEGRGWDVRHSKSTEFPVRYGNTLVIGMIGDGKADVDWRPAYEVVAPGMRLLSAGKKKGYIIEYPDIYEDYEKVDQCEGDGC